MKSAIVFDKLDGNGWRIVNDATTTRSEFNLFQPECLNDSGGKHFYRRMLSVHLNLIDEVTVPGEAVSLWSASTFPAGRMSKNSSHGTNSTAAERLYSEAFAKLAMLSDDEDEDSDDHVEVGAIESARVILNYLLDRSAPAPYLTWHGGDAIALLWTVSDSSYAMTITDGQIGYVVRRGKERTRIEHSIPIHGYIMMTSDQ